MDLLEITEKEKMGRAEAARLALATALARKDDVEYERGDLRFEVNVPDEIDFKLEIESRTTSGSSRSSSPGVRSAAVERGADELVVDEAALERVVAAAVDSPAVERVAAQVIESRLLDTIVERLLESEELWLLVDEIARSPSVTEAIGQQSVGFADQVAGQVRIRSQRADARVERVARRLLRREEQ